MIETQNGARVPFNAQSLERRRMLLQTGLELETDSQWSWWTLSHPPHRMVTAEADLGIFTGLSLAEASGLTLAQIEAWISAAVGDGYVVQARNLNIYAEEQGGKATPCYRVTTLGRWWLRLWEMGRAL